MKRIISLLIAAIVVCTISSCRRIPLYDPASSVYLRLDIRLNTDIVLNDDIDIEGNAELKEKVHGKMPETVRACFYSTETHKLVAEEFLPPEGGFVDIAAGTYDIIVYSLGNEVTRTDGTDTRAGSHALTSETGATVRITYDADDTKALEDYKAIHKPDHIFVGTKENAEVPVHAHYGWDAVIPLEHWADGFISDDQHSATTNTEVNFQIYTDPYNRGDGYTYFPDGYLASKDNPAVQTAFFPYVGTRNGNGTYADAGWKTWYWSCNPEYYFSGEALALEMSSWGDSAINGCFYRSQACSIRCVREDY